MENLAKRIVLLVFTLSVCYPLRRTPDNNFYTPSFL